MTVSLQACWSASIRPGRRQQDTAWVQNAQRERPGEKCGEIVKNRVFMCNSPYGTAAGAAGLREPMAAAKGNSQSLNDALRGLWTLKSGWSI